LFINILEFYTTGKIITIVDKRKKISELDEPPARGLFLWRKMG
jgi:hypothetical protein